MYTSNTNALQEAFHKELLIAQLKQVAKNYRINRCKHE